MNPGADRERLGDFEIVREIGRGGMGVVYEARQVSLNRKVALKVLSESLGLTPKAVERFRREALAAGKLHHTNIVPVYTGGPAEGFQLAQRTSRPSGGLTWSLCLRAALKPG
jgi:serine/threonine protein kinase